MHPPHPSLLAGCCVFEPLSSAACNINLFESPSIWFRGWLLCCSPPRGHRPSINYNWTCWCVALSSSFSSSFAPMQFPQRSASVHKLIVMLLRCCSNCIYLHAHHLCTESAEVHQLHKSAGHSSPVMWLCLIGHSLSLAQMSSVGSVGSSSSVEFPP